ncbi:MAG: DNA polymerase Y family protein [Xanthomonadales bacterium]|nr:DNA polymerase Y family protein [Xanthomonadales bacterium]
MVTSPDTRKSPQWLALHFPLLEDPDSLERLAGWCYRYSSQVCIATPNSSLLLEIAASRRLFGSARTLARQICTELEQHGLDATSGIAPTPEAALIAARHGLRIRAMANIQKTIGALGIDSLNLESDAIEALQKMGFCTAIEIFRLPRKALARRLGPSTANYLDRLLGRRADPRKAFQPPDNFSAGLDLADTEHTQGLVFPLKRLVQELCGVLRARDRGIQRLQVCLQLHEGRQNIALDLRQVTRSEIHLLLLLRERLERLQLPCPVRHIRLQTPEFLPFAASQADLLQDGDTLQDSSTIERLQARLGTNTVQGITARQDHRPEHSWSIRELDTPATYTTRPGRPSWLFPEPRPCRIADYRVLTGPERIESGWWDGGDCRRDYFIVQDSNGGALWAFREYKPRPGWYLHGLFS